LSEIKSFSLSDILGRIKSIIDEKTAGKSFWLRAEISNITFHMSGHCYIDLVETKENNMIAQCNATIWSSNLSSIRYDLNTDFGNILKKGNEFLCLAKINFTQLYGLRIDIQKVDISFSLGNLEKTKQETIDRLKREGIFEANKLKKPPLVVKRIALITSISTSGYADFHKQVDNNKYGYQFEIVDFNVTVQGDKAVGEICQRLEYLNSQNFDIVAIIRGGGSKLDLDVFNHYTLAKTVATHKLPVYTGIGHETDISVVDMVASMYHKTPTALGAYIVEQAHNFDVRVSNTWTAIKECQNLYFETERNWYKLNIQTLTSESISKIQRKRGDLHTVQTRINTKVMDTLNIEKGKLIDAIAFIRSEGIVKTQRKRADLRTALNRINVEIMVIINFERENMTKAKMLLRQKPAFILSNRIQYMGSVIEEVKAYHPSKIMKKGFAIPRYKGILYNGMPLKFNEELEIELLNQTLVVSFIKSKEHGKHQL